MFSLNLFFVINPDLEGLTARILPINSISIERSQNLQNLNGFRDLEIRGLYLSELPSLTDIGDLNKLNSKSFITIRNCTKLEDISVFNDSDTLNIKLNGNESLSICAWRAICNSLSTGGFVDINNNNVGCNSNEEVKSQCLSSTIDIDYQTKLFPNPVSEELFIISDIPYDTYSIYNLDGKLITRGSVINKKIPLDYISPNIYIVKLSKGIDVFTHKIIKI